MITFKQKLKKFLIKTNLSLERYDPIFIIVVILTMGYIYAPNIRWIYPFGIVGALVALILFTIIACPLIIVIVIAFPLLWLAEKMQGTEQINEKD